MRERVWVNITHTHSHTRVGKSMGEYAPGRRTESHAGAPVGARGVRLRVYAPGQFGGGEWVIENEDANQERDSKSHYGGKLLYIENTFYREQIP